MLKFFRSLTAPNSWLDLVDLLSKTAFAAAAALITMGVWIYKDQQDKADKQAAAAVEKEKTQFDQRLRLLSQTTTESADKRQNIELFLNVLPKDASDPDWRLKTQSLSAYCVEQSKAVSTRPPLLSMLCDANAQKTVEFTAGETAKPTTTQTDAGTTYLRSSVATAQVAKLAAVEAAVTGPPSPHWYAVVASVPLNQPNAAADLARSLNTQLAVVTGTCDVRVFKTRISNSFAITSGADKNEADAKARVALIKGSGLVPDAFAQPDKGWVMATVDQPTRSLRPPCKD
jgi:hypothetical protein